MVNPIGKILGWTVIGVSLGHAAIKTYGTAKDAADLSTDIPKVWGWREMLTSEQAILLGISAGTALLLYGPGLWAKLKERAGQSAGGKPASAPTARSSMADVATAAALSLVEEQNRRTQKRRQNADALADFLDRANELRRRTVQSDEQFNTWKADYQNWHQSVINFLRDSISHTSAHHFSRGQLIIVSAMKGAHNEEHNGLLNQLVSDYTHLQHTHAMESDGAYASQVLPQGPQGQPSAPKPRTRDLGEIGRELEALDAVVKFLDREITAAINEGRRLLNYYSGIFRHRERIPAFVRELETYRDTLRSYNVRLEQMTHENTRYTELASTTDGHPCSPLVSRVDNLVREINYAANSLPEDMKADDLLRFVSAQYSYAETALDEFVRWRNKAHKALIDRHRKLTPGT